MLTTNFSLLHTANCCTQTRNCVTQLRTIVSFLPFSRPIDSTSSGMYIRPGIHRLIGHSVVVAQSLPMWVWRFSLSVKALFHQSQCVSVLRTFVLSHVFSWPLCLILSITDIPQKSHCCCWWPVYYYGEFHAFLACLFLHRLYCIHHTGCKFLAWWWVFRCSSNWICIQTSHRIHNN